MAGVGGPFMLAGLTTLLAQLIVQLAVERRLGVAALGRFQAAWTLSTTYLGLVLGALAKDYYPRLVAALPRRHEFVAMVNDQVEVLLTLTAPVLLGLLAASPLVLRMFYSAEFEAAGPMLRWQILGDVLKLASWPLGFVLLASGAGRSFLLAEAAAMAIFAAATWWLLPFQGLRAAGQAFLLMYLVYLPLVYALGRSATGLRWRGAVVGRLLLLLAAAGIVAACAGTQIGGWVGAGFSLGFAAEALFRLGVLRSFSR